MTTSHRWASELIPIAAITGACFFLPAGGVVVGLVGNVAAGLATPLAQRGSDWCMQRILRQKDVLNHDLQAAMLRAFDLALHDLQKQWLMSHQRDATSGRRPDAADVEAVKGLFASMRADAKIILSADHLKGIIGSPETIQLLDRGGMIVEAPKSDDVAPKRGDDSKATAETITRPLTDADWLAALESLKPVRITTAQEPNVLLAYLAPYLYGHSEELTHFIHNYFQAQLACRFGEELKTDTRAWRTFQRLVNDSLLDGIHGMHAKQDEAQLALNHILQELEEWQGRLIQLPTTERETTGDDGLDHAITALRDQLETLRQEMRQLAEMTWDRVGEDGDETRRVVDLIPERTAHLVMERVGPELAKYASPPPAPKRRIQNLTHPPSRYFVGRTGELERLHQHFHDREGALALVQIIQGLGGVGKTQLAVHYAHAYAHEYDGIWWLRAGSVVTLTADYADLGRRLRLPVEEVDSQEDMISAVRLYLEQGGGKGERWLLIFDNATPEETGLEIERLRPIHGNCDVLITSRVRDWSHIAEPFDVDILSDEDSAYFLAKRSGDPDDVSARALAKELGGLPLALEQAGAYVAAQPKRRTLATYLAQFLNSPYTRMEKDPARTGDYREVVATTWAISLQAVTVEDSAARDLLSICALFSPDRIPIDLILEKCDCFPDRLADTVQDPDRAGEIVGILLRYSLIDAATQDMISMHRLVQLVIREWMSESEKETWSLAALNIINETFPYDIHRSENRRLIRLLMPHAEVIASLVQEIHQGWRPECRLRNQMGLWYQSLAQYRLAELEFRRSLLLSERLYGNQHTETATRWNGLGAALQGLGDLDGAQACFENAIRIDELVFGIDSPRMVGTLGNLGELLHAKGILDGSRNILERAVAIGTNDPGVDDQTLAYVLNSLAGVLRAAGERSLAEEHWMRVLTIVNEGLSLEHPLRMAALSNLGMLYLEQSELGKSQEMFDLALLTSEQVNGVNHHMTVTILNNLGGLYERREDLAESKRHFQQAVLAGRVVYQPHCHEIATLLANLARVEHARGEIDDARSHYEEAVPLFRLVSSRHQLPFVHCLLDFAAIVKQQDGAIAAKPLLDEALRLARLVPDAELFRAVAHAAAIVTEEAGDLIGSALIWIELLKDTQNSASSDLEGKCFFYLSRIAESLDRDSDAVSLTGLAYAVDEKIKHPLAHLYDLPAFWDAAYKVGLNDTAAKLRLKGILSRYDVDRGAAIVQKAFPESVAHP